MLSVERKKNEGRGGERESESSKVMHPDSSKDTSAYLSLHFFEINYYTYSKMT